MGLLSYKNKTSLKNRILNNAKFNKVIFYLTFSDIFNWGAIDVINSLVGIFIAEKFGDSAIEYVGIGFAIINITKASLQIPIGLLVDKIAGNKDEIVFLIFGSIFYRYPFLLYPLITTKNG
ncbi:MAG: hypothetical protein Q9M91_08660, partial [Candidatus Dojkabacteria bacterium]|nr:hypothetical protein [Candidatus Dojkabacteria bacterium]